jgi:hypothetical protein
MAGRRVGNGGPRLPFSYRYTEANSSIKAVGLYSRLNLSCDSTR